MDEAEVRTALDKADDVLEDVMFILEDVVKALDIEAKTVLTKKAVKKLYSVIIVMDLLRSPILDFVKTDLLKRYDGVFALSNELFAKLKSHVPHDLWEKQVFTRKPVLFSGPVDPSNYNGI